MKASKLLYLSMPLLLAGCGATTPVTLDNQLGESVHTALAEQILNPEASQDTRSVVMIDGETASALVGRYHRSFERPTAINIFNLGVGGTGTTLGPVTGTGR